MPEREGHDIHAETRLLEENVGLLLERLAESRQENELLRSELASLQDVLRSYRLPGSEPLGGSGSAGSAEPAVAYAEKVQMKQKLVRMLQKIDQELRNVQTL